MSNEAVIKLEQVSIYQDQNLVISEFSLELVKGEFVYLIGRTGSGKSSLLKTLYGELPLAHGNGTVAGFNLRTLKSAEIPYLRRKLGVVFQDFQLLSDRTVNANLHFVMKATGWKNEQEIQSKINDVLEKVGLTAKGSKMPYELSGGEQQRVSIARALVNDPELILADEPTGNLDPETSQEIMNLLLNISKQGKSVLFATHDFLLYNRFPSRTLKCEQGKITDSQVAGSAS